MNHSWLNFEKNPDWFYDSVCEHCGKRAHLLRGSWYNGGAWCRGCRKRLPRPERERPPIPEWKFVDEHEI